MASTSRYRLSRRHLAAGGAALLSLAGARAKASADPVSPDEALIAHCAAFDALEEHFLATEFDNPPGTPAEAAAMAERMRLVAAQQYFLDKICASRPTTLEGCRALAHTLVSQDRELLEQKAANGYQPDRLLLVLLGGLTGRA